MQHESAKPWFIGLACDRNYVEHTAVTLTSLDINGDVPEAVVTVVTFDLVDEDYDVLRAGAGRLARNMRFLEVSPAMLAGIDASRWHKAYPPPIIGRLFLPDTIDAPDARLITLDSDMIVNASLRPLFELRLGSEYIAACHDIPRVDDPNYFNSGLMVIDVARYRHYNIARRALDWLGSDGAQSVWPDQDALNLMVGHLWHRLDYRWNMHCLPVARAMTLEDYEQAFIAHYAAVKPWRDLHHVGRPLYVRYLELFRQRMSTQVMLHEQVDAAFIVTAQELLLGREPDSDEAVAAMRGLSASEVIRAILSSSEFAATTLLSLKLDMPFASGTFTSPLGRRHRLWAADRLRVTRATAPRLAAASSWRALLLLLLNDSRFVEKAGLGQLMNFADAVRARLEEEVDRQDAWPEAAWTERPSPATA